MSADFETSAALKLARMQATLTALDAGAGYARIVVYASARPEAIDIAHTSPAQFTVELAKPCGQILSGTLTLNVRDPAGSMVMHQGIPRWADLIAANGQIFIRAKVTDIDHDGGFRIEGAGTPDGDDSPLLYAGSKAQLGAVVLV